MDTNKLILCDLVESIDPTFEVSEGDDFFYIHKNIGTNRKKEINALVFLDWALLDSFIVQIKGSCVIVDGMSSVVEINLAEIDSLDRLKSVIKSNMIEVMRFDERSSRYNK